MTVRLLALAALAVALPASAQTAPDSSHSVPTKPAVLNTIPTFQVQAFEVDPENPPPGSGVARAGAGFNATYVQVVYGQPYARGEQVFGGIVPFGEVWTTGAGQATEIMLTRPVLFGGRRLDAGVYSLFTTPRPDIWTVHVNVALGSNGTEDYARARDVVTAFATPETLDETVPALTIDFVPAEDANGVDLRIRWERTGIRVPIRPITAAPAAPATPAQPVRPTPVP